MKELDDILKEHEKCYAPVYVGGKEYPGNNPYFLNRINNLLEAGKLSFGDIQVDGKIVERVVYEGHSDYLFNTGLNEIADDLNKEYGEIVERQRAQRGEPSPFYFEVK
jgi:hypothetical protein